MDSSTPADRPGGPPAPRPGRAFLFYSSLRLLLLLLSYVVLLLIGLQGLLAVGAAVLLSALLSLVLLREQRDAFTRASMARSELRRQERAERRRRLDAEPEDPPAG